MIDNLRQDLIDLQIGKYYDNHEVRDVIGKLISVLDNGFTGCNTHGRWQLVSIPKRYGGWIMCCSECRKRSDTKYNYCPNCGAMMDLD